MSIRTIARGAAWGLTGTAALVLLAYWIFIAINWTDQPPSPAARDLTRLVESRPRVVDADNGYTYLLALGAPRDADVAALGARRQTWLAQLPATASGLAAEMPGRDVEAKTGRSPDVTAIADACSQGGRQCVDLLAQHPEVADRWLVDERWRAERYEELLTRHGWREVIPANPLAPLPPYQHALNGQLLYLMETWRAARAGDALLVRDRLDRDTRFWRGVLASSDLLITKMIAAAALKRDFTMGTIVLGALEPASIGGSVPPSWRMPMSREERSMLRVLAGEWRWSTGVMGLAAHGVNLDGSRTDAATRAASPGMQPQDTANQYAAIIVEYANSLDVDIAKMPSALSGASRQAAARSRPFRRVYNLIGDILISIPPATYDSYAARVSDLEGARRAAMLVADLNAQGVEPGDVAQALEHASVRDPYTGAAFAFDPGTRSVVLTGLENSERGRYVFAY